MSLRQTVAAIVFLALFHVVLAQSAEDPDAERNAMRSVISRQLAAIQADDEAGAFGYNTQELRQHFETPAKFMRMVREHFDALYHAESSEFVEVTTMQADPSLKVQALKLRGPEGRVWLAIYEMRRDPDAGWQVARCSLRHMEDYFK